MTLTRSIETIADPLYGLGSGAGELVVGYVDLLSTLTLLSDPSSGRSLDGSAKARPHGSSRTIDRRSVWAGRRLDYELADLSETVTGLSTFIESPREIPKRNASRLLKAPVANRVLGPRGLKRQSDRDRPPTPYECRARIHQSHWVLV